MTRLGQATVAVLVAIWLALAMFIVLSCNVPSSQVTRSDGGLDASPCGTCDITELCVQNAAQDAAACLPICANGLHCWSACCVTLPSDAGYSVCMSVEVCWPTDASGVSKP